eukprot:2151202-Pyramimonas_sp.AAC.1
MSGSARSDTKLTMQAPSSWHRSIACNWCLPLAPVAPNATFGATRPNYPLGLAQKSHFSYEPPPLCKNTVVHLTDVFNTLIVQPLRLLFRASRAPAEGAMRGSQLRGLRVTPNFVSDPSPRSR